MDRILNFLGSLFGDRRLPKSFRDTLKKHNDKMITQITICRTPLSNVAKTFANILSLGKFEEIAKRQGESGFFHLYSIVTLDDGTSLLLEKNETPVLSPRLPQQTKETECVNVSGSNITLGEFVSKAVKRMGMDLYNRYSATQYNCQDFLLNHLKANGLSNKELQDFIHQDLTDLIEETPSFSRQLSEGITDIAGKARELWEELTAKKGIKIKRGMIRPSIREYRGVLRR